MPQFIPSANAIKAQFQYLIEGQKIQNSVQFRFEGVLYQESMGPLMDELKPWYLGDLADQMGSNVQLTGIKLTAMGDADGKILEWSPATAEYGHDEGPSGPNNVCLCIRLGTGSRGKSAHGRVYVPGCNQANISGSYFSTLYRDNCVAAWAKLVDPAHIFAHRLIVASYYHDGQPRTTAQQYYVTDFSADTVVDSQRRRLPGRGE